MEILLIWAAGRATDVVLDLVELRRTSFEQRHVVERSAVAVAAGQLDKKLVVAAAVEVEVILR